MSKSLLAGPLDPEQAVGEDQMAGRGNRQELSQPLDNAEETGGKIIDRVHDPLRCPRARRLSREPTPLRPPCLSGWFRSRWGLGARPFATNRLAPPGTSN